MTREQQLQRWKTNSHRYYGENKEKILARQKEYYEKNKSHKIRVKRERIIEIRLQLNSLKESQPCDDCGLHYPSVCMDFDHRDPKQKVIGIAQAVNRGWSWEKLQTEIDKCDLVCSNCHRMRTFIQQDER